MFRNLIVICVIFPNILFSQIQNTSYNSLNTHSSSRVLSMGGDVISIFDNDVSLANFTPSLLNEKMDKQIAFNFVDYLADINFISFYSAKKISENLMLFTGIDAINYGEFNGTDVVGNSTATFNSSQQIITIGSSKKISNNFTFGANIKLLNSNFIIFVFFKYFFSISKKISLSLLISNKFNNFFLLLFR